MLLVWSDAWKMATKLKLRAIVILGVEANGEVTVVSWGKGTRRSKVIGEWAQGLWDKGVIGLEPFRTYFGWGTNGVPPPRPRKRKGRPVSAESAQNMADMEQRRKARIELANRTEEESLSRVARSLKAVIAAREARDK